MIFSVREAGAWRAGWRTLILVGFDFPLGLPFAYGIRTGLRGFKEALSVFGQGEWQDFFKVANLPEEVSIRRPFYPNVSKRGYESDACEGSGCADLR